jgi:hypothetical protein
MSSALGVDLHLTGWSHKASLAVAEQWVGQDRRSASTWDWNAIQQAYNNELDRFDVAMWVGDRLCGLSISTISRDYVNIKFLEGDPRPDCPLRPYRAAIALEAAQNYGQASGRRFLRVQPVNPRLETLYRDIFRFTLETTKGGRAYYKREIP